MAKQQQNPKTVLNIFYRHGTKVGIGTLHEQAELLKLMEDGCRGVNNSILINAINPDENIESDTIVIMPDDIIFYSIRVPRAISGLITDVPPGLLDKSVQ